MNFRLILASGSPRRKEILANAFIPFEIIVSNCDENIKTETPEELVKELSFRKASAVEKELDEQTLILGADTVVAIDSRVLMKPGNEKEAEEMLTLLSGSSHRVLTGVTLLLPKKNGKRKCIRFVEKTAVMVYPLTKQQITSYIKTGEPMDKAGAYAIQGRFAPYIKRINGDYLNVVGLPLARICQCLLKEGINLLEPEEK